MEPNDNLKVFMNFRRLKDIKRCNNFPVVSAEDVAQHSYYVTLLAMSLATEYNHWAGNNNLQYHPYDDEHRMEIADVTEVIKKALSHDLEESFTSDIPWNIKHMTKELNRQISQAIHSRMDQVYANCDGVLDQFHQYGNDCKKGFEGKFVDVADMLELSIYCMEEQSKGNTWMKSLLGKSINLLEQHELYDTLMKSSPLFHQIMLFIKGDLCPMESLIDIN